MIGGIDEAGRGPVFGPLVVAGVSGSDQALFKALGAKDSKVLSDSQRQRLSREIRHQARKVETVLIPADDIDKRRDDESLNEIEVSAFAWIARRLNVEELFVDAADVDASRFGREIARHLQVDSDTMRVVAEHRADSTYAVVSAASIIAKVTRDQEVLRMAAPLEKKIGLPFGSGYPSDEVTVRFLEAYYRRFGDFPAGTRRTWDTARIIEERVKTRRLDEFLVATVTPRRA